MIIKFQIILLSKKILCEAFKKSWKGRKLQKASFLSIFYAFSIFEMFKRYFWSKA